MLNEISGRNLEVISTEKSKSAVHRNLKSKWASRVCLDMPQPHFI